MQRLLFLSAVLTLTVASHSTQAHAAGDPEPGWPQVNGPMGNFNPRRYGHKLVDDLSQAKTVWISEDSDLGYGKTSSSGFVSNRAIWPGHPGSANGLIAAEGMIFASSFRPAGDAWAENHHAAAAMSKYGPEEQKSLRRGLSIDADDFAVAIDMASGKTVWKAFEKGKGLFRGMGKRSGWGVTPAYHAGRVFSMGTTGRLYCYDAKTGKKLWETDIGKTHEAWEAEKQKHLQEKTLPSGGQYVSLVVADGVLVVPLYDGLDVSLRGVDVETGKTLWEVPAATARTATPALWQHQGREYVLAATHGFGDYRQGKLRLIDPKGGKVLWTVEGLGNTHFALAPSEERVLVNVGSKTKGHGDVPWMLLGCYRLSPEGAKLIWTMPDELDFWHEARYEASDWRKYLIRDGKVYYYSRSRNPDKSDVSAFFIFDERTGKVLFRQRGRRDDTVPVPGQHYLIEDRLLQVPDASHSDRLTLRLWTADPKDLRPLCPPWRPPHTATTAYNVFMEFPYVGGRIFMRSREGTVRCYDLRKPKGVTSIDLRFDNPYVGRPEQSLPFEAGLWVVADKLDRGCVRATPASGLQDQNQAGSNRAIGLGDTVLSDRGLHGMLSVPVGYHREAWEVHLERDGNRLQGTYERRIDPLPKPFATKGKITGRVTGNADGSTSWELKLDAAIAKDEADMASARNVYFEIHRPPDGSVCVASKHGLTVANHEVDASQLTVESDVIRGQATVIVHGDRWHAPNMHSGGALAATYKIDARIDGATIAGDYEGTVGVEYRHGGKVAGEVAEETIARR